MLLCCCLWFSALSLNASAASDDGVLYMSDFSASMARNNQGAHYPFEDGVVTYGKEIMHYFHCTDPSFYANGETKVLMASEITDVSSGHKYTLKFKHAVNYTGSYSIKILINSTNVYEEDFPKSQSVRFTDVTFTMPDNISSNTASVIIIMTIPDVFGYGINGENVRYLISEEIIFNDDTDNPGWLGRILKKINDLGDRIGGWFVKLGDRIGGFFTDLGKSIGGFFTDLWENLKQSFKDVGQWFKDLGDRIQGFFVDLYNDIIQGLKDLFIPADDYFSNYMQKTKDWAKARLGFLYTSGELMLDTVMNLKELLRDDYSFVLPAAKFTLNGQTYTLWEDYNVPMKELISTNTFMKVAYGTYKTLLSAALAFALFSYAQRVFNKIMAN